MIYEYLFSFYNRYSYFFLIGILFIMKKFSNYFLTFIIIVFAFALLLFSSSNIVAVRSAIELCLDSIFPSLFPFLIVSELLSYTSLIPFLSAKFERIMRPLFKVPGIGSYPFILGFISGYPVGAKIVSNLRSNNKISKIDGERLLVFTNNAGPLFIIGSIGFSMYLNSTIGFLILGVNIFSSIITGIIFSHFYKFEYRNSYSSVVESELNFSSLGEIISSCIKKAFYTLSTVCGFIIIFSLIISMINSSGILSFIHNQWIEYTILGLLEITNGIKLISSIPFNNLLPHLVITAFLIGTSGLSVLLQVWSIISKTDLSIKPYFIGKLLNGIISATVMFAFLTIFPIFQFSI